MSTKKTKLIAIGYWHSCYEPDFPDPAKFIDKNWDAYEKQQVILHLEKGKSIAEWMGVSWCRFRCNEINMGAKCLTDGFYIYPEGLIHYIKKHNVKLPKKFIQHVLEKNVDENIIEYQNYNIDYSWWKKQIGFDLGNNEKSFLASTDTEIKNYMRRNK